MNIEKDFLEGKKSAFAKLQKAQKEGKVDEGILPILFIINESDDYYATSSCYGRIVLLEIPNIGDKKAAKFLGKWHRTIDVDELFDAARKAKLGQIWLLAQSPIIHVTTKTKEAADMLLKTAVACSFKHSGLKSLGKKIVVEVCSTERFDVPVGKDGVLFCNRKHLELLTDISNEILKKSTQKLQKFEKNLGKVLSTSKTTNS